MKKMTQVVKAPYRFTRDEVLAMAQEQAALFAQIAEKETELESLKKQYAGEVKVLEDRASKLLNFIRSGVEYRETLCFARTDFRRGERLFIEVTTGEVVQRKPLSPGEVQRQLELEEAAERERVETETAQSALDWFAARYAAEQPNYRAEHVRAFLDDRLRHVTQYVAHLVESGQANGDVLGVDSAFDLAEARFDEFAKILDGKAKQAEGDARRKEEKKKAREAKKAEAKKPDVPGEETGQAEAPGGEPSTPPA